MVFHPSGSPTTPSSRLLRARHRGSGETVIEARGLTKHGAVLLMAFLRPIDLVARSLIRLRGWVVRSHVISRGRRIRTIAPHLVSQVPARSDEDVRGARR